VPFTEWVAGHRRHHAFTDREGDPHSPWRYVTSVPALAKGLRTNNNRQQL
jgi:stearoyl-CoA desaturase (delta-9 desaturase)